MQIFEALFGGFGGWKIFPKLFPIGTDRKQLRKLFTLDSENVLGHIRKMC